jgi:hypothetical protein
MFANTQLVREASDPKEIARMTRMRMMDPSEVGQALMDALRLDSSGACLAVIPDAPLTDMPNFNWPMVFVLVVLGKVLRVFDLKVPTANPYVVIVGAVAVLWLLLYLLSFVSCLFC